MNQEIKNAMRAILQMSGAIDNIRTALSAAETSITNGEIELAELQSQLQRKTDELIDLLTQ